MQGTEGASVPLIDYSTINYVLNSLLSAAVHDLHNNYTDANLIADIIDGFGSYPHHFMKTAVFSGLGNVAFKYYMLFQQQSVPDEQSSDEPSWLLGASRGPYINEYSRSIFMFLGKKVAFLGLDCRTERMVCDYRSWPY